MSPVIAPAALPPTTLQAPLSVPAAVVQKAKPAPHGWTAYTVRSGDTLEGIATRTGTTTGRPRRPQLPARAAATTSRSGSGCPCPGRPPRPAPSGPRAQAAAAARAAAIRRATYVVRAGDTLSHIAARKGVSLASLLKANRLSTRSVLQVGQKIRIPGAAGTASSHRPAAATTRYRVRSGDTLSAIATRTRTPLASLYSLNRLGPRSVIHPGQVVRVRGTAPAATRASGTRGIHGPLGRHPQRHRRRATTWASPRCSRPTGSRRARSSTRGSGCACPPRPAKAPTSSNTFAGRTYPSSTVNAAARNRAALARTAVPSRSQTKAMIVATARRHGVDPRLALAVAWQESGWNQRQVSVANAIGVMQVIPSSGEWASAAERPPAQPAAGPRTTSPPGSSSCAR